jgi:Flp pilus assembly pilin Flp
MLEMKARRSGQGLVEYVLIIALVAIALVGIMVAFRDSIGGILDATTNDVVECATPGQGGDNPGHGGDAPGQCKKSG